MSGTDTPPSSRLPPLVPVVPPSASAYAASHDSEAASPPPPPPKTFRVSHSPLMQATLTPASPPPSHPASIKGSPVPIASPALSMNGSPAPPSPAPGSGAVSAAGSPTSTSMSPSRSWTRMQAQQPFVNGRGNVQLPGAARQFVPSGPGSSGGSPNLSLASSGSPGAHSPSIQREGQQAYVRRDPSPGPGVGSAPMSASLSASSSGSGSGSGGGQRRPSLPLDHALPSGPASDGAPAVGYLPSQFGVRQRVAIRQSTRPVAPRSSAGRGSLSGSTTVSMVVDPVPTPSPALSASSDSHHSPSFITAPRSSSLHPSAPPSAASHAPSYSHSTPPSTHTPSPSPSPGASPTHAQPHAFASTPTSSPAPASSSLAPPAAPPTGAGSVLSRPRPKTPDPFASGPGTGTGTISTSFASRGGAHAPILAPTPRAPPASQAVFSPTSSVLDRPRPKTPDAAGALGLAQSAPASAGPAGTSVLDRPRPKTPDAGAAFRFGQEGGETSVSDGRPCTPDSGAVFAFKIPPLAYDAAPPPTTSVLDRPRPRTPDSQAYLDGAGAGSAATVRAAAPGVGTGTSPIVERQLNAEGHGRNGLHAPSASASYDSLASSSHRPSLSASGSSSALGGASPVRPSFDSLGVRGGPTTTTSTSASASASGLSSTFSFGSASAASGSPARGTFPASTSTSSTGTSTSFLSSAFSSAPPMLNLDFDFGGSPFGSGETMFGLSDLLKPSSTSSSTTAPPPVSAPSAVARGEDATTPTPTTERKDLGAALPASTAPASSASTPMALTPSASSSLATTSTGGGYLAAGPSHPAHAAASASGRHTPRKEPPKVDLKLELELEMERAIPVHRPIVDERERDGDEGRAKRVRREREDDGEESEAEAGAGAKGKGRAEPGMVREQASFGSLSSYGGGGASVNGHGQGWGHSGTGTGSMSDASILSSAGGSAGQGAKGGKRRRRRSLASLLSIGGASLLGKDKEKDKEPERSRTPEPGMRSYTPEPGMRSFTPEPGMSRPAPQQGAPPILAPPSVGTFAPRLSLDKSLPPTPASPSPLPQRSPPSSSHGHGVDPSNAGTGDSPTKRGGALGRQLSRLRNRSNPSPVPPASREPGFRVISATTTRARAGHGAKASVSSIGTSETHGSFAGSRRESNEFGVFAGQQLGGPVPSGLPFSGMQPVAGPFEPLPLAQPPSAPPPAAPASTPSAPVPFGRRIAERFAKISSSSNKASAGAASETYSAPVKDHSAPAPNGAGRPHRRRSSLSSLLGVGLGSASADGHGAPSSSGAPTGKRILGMSLPAGRKSEDLLVSGRNGTGRGPEREMRREWESPVVRQKEEHRRKSLDALTGQSEAAVPRRPSTDDLLTLATAKLSKLAVEEPPLTASTIAPPVSATASTFESHDTASFGSGHSTPSDEVAGKAAAVVAHATLINRSEASAVPSIPASTAPTADAPQYPRTAAPVLVRSDSLRSGAARSAVGTASALPSLSTGPGTASTPTAEPTPKTTESSAVWRKPRGKAPDSGVGSDASMSSAWLQLEDALILYTAAVQENRPDRGSIVNNSLLPFLRHEEDHPAARVNEVLAQRQRSILFGWLINLTVELREMQPAHRGACLEAVAAIAESHFLSAAALQDDPHGQVRYRSAVVQILDFAVEKLNDKAVYANTLVFSGRVFALAFFRIEGVALKLLRALPPVKRSGLRRILEETGVKEDQLPPADLETFPSHLWSLCLRDFRAYANLLLPPKTTPMTEDDGFLVRDGDVSVEMSGNWLIRWTASDSDLPFAFYRAYHRQLASHLVPFEAREDVAGQPPVAPSVIVTAPGFLFLAASLLEKADSLIHRNLRSVTSIGPNSGNFNTNDSANLSFGQKPKVLELAHRRLVQTMLDIVGGARASPGSDAEVAPDAEVRRHVFGNMLQVWLRATAKRTSLWDTRGVFLLFDLVEGWMYSLAYPSPSAARSSEDDDAVVPRPDEASLELFDFPFLFSVIKMLLLKADSTVTLMRVTSAVYSHFELFTLRVKDRTALVEDILLDKEVFIRQFLHWNSGVRGYYLRLLVWRVSRLGVVAQEQNPNAPPDEGIVAIFNLLNARLEAVRKRHDALEPLDNLTDDDYFFRPKRSTICSTRGVKEAPWTVDALAEPLDEEDVEEEPQELVRSLPPAPASASSGMSGTSSKKGDLKTVAKVVSWLKGGLGKKQGKSKGSPEIPDARIDPFVLERSDTVPSRRRGDSTASATVEDDELTAESASQEWPSAPLPTTIETGIVPVEDSPGPHTPAAPVETPRAKGNKNNLTIKPPPPFPSAVKPLERGKSSRSEKRRSLNPAFFAFEFENGVVTRSDVDPAVASSGASVASVNTTGSGDTTFPASPIRTRHGDLQSAISPRVSLRFSKRISILPPAALDLLKEAQGEGVEAVPPIPARFRQSVEAGYDKKLHPYAIRGLRDYEDALDEWTDWVARLQEEEENGGKLTKGFIDVVPRLAVNWPLQQGED
ncbi:hypothetical protein JCM10207_003748 [Rhodosporidiobolus poonsookiae]